MTTTSHFQKFPNYYYTLEECLASRDVVTNARYDGFTQLHFTAGDEAQFEAFRDPTNGSICPSDIDLSNNRHSSLPPVENVDWSKYMSLTPTAVSNTFKYIFHKMKKGIFIKIKDGAMRVFLPFSNARFVNEWGSSIKPPPGFQDFQTFFNHTSELVGMRGKRIIRDPSKWYGNNCLIRAEMPLSEGDSSFGCMYDMFDELCKVRKVPDCEFFVNKRDFPLITKNCMEPYDCMFPSDTPLLSHCYDKYAPILSMVTSDRHADIPIPTWEDWARTSNELDGRLFDKGRSYNMTFDIKWSDKVPTAVFRGASTGVGTTIETNPRLKLAHMHFDRRTDIDGVPFLDAGITKWNVRPRKEAKNDHLTTIEVDKIGLSLIHPLSPQEQSRYKYIINVDGHVSAFRLSLEMKMGSVILLVNSTYRLWYHKLLFPYVHYVPVKEDLSDIYDQIKWCKSHDDECAQMVENCKEFYQKYLCRDSILDYLQNLLVSIKTSTGHYLYNEIKMDEVMRTMEMKILDQDVGTLSGTAPILLPRLYRNYGIYHGVEAFIKSLGQTVKNVLEEQDASNLPTAMSKLVPVSFNGISMLEKESSVHEAFIGLVCVNEFLRDIPNFMYTFGRFQKDGKDFTIVERVDGVPLCDYIKSEKCGMNDVVSIFIQLGLSIEYAQRQCGFIHWDLYPWNVVVRSVQEPLTIQYPMSERGVYTVTTKVVPTIIDYGRSQAYYQGKVYKSDFGLLECRLQDMISIILSTIDSFLNMRRDNRDVRIILQIINKYFARTDYLPHEFTNIRDLKDWLSQRRKYSEMLYSNKGHLGERDVLSLVDFLMRVEGQSGVKLTSVEQARDDVIDSQTIFRHLANIPQEPEETIRCLMDSIVPHKNLFKMFRQAQELDLKLMAIENALKVCNNPLPPIVKCAHRAIQQSLSGDTTPQCIRYTRHIYPSNPVGPIYTPDMLEDPLVLLKLSKSVMMYLVKDYTKERKMVSQVLTHNGRYRLPEDARKFYVKNFRNLINMSPFAVCIDIGRRNTFIEIVKQIMSSNIGKHPNETVYTQVLKEIEF